MGKTDAKTILIIDDEPDIRAYLMVVLEDCGYRTIWADGGKRIDHLIGRDRPDLILLDIMMPYRSGITLYHELRTIDQLTHVPIVLISGMALDAEFKASFMKTGFLKGTDCFIEKPIDIPELLDVVKRLLED